MLFPVANATEVDKKTNATVTTVVGSPVLAATVGLQLSFSGLAEPVRILLRLNELGVSDRNSICNKWLYIYINRKNIWVTSTYYGHLSCMPVVYVTRYKLQGMLPI